MLLSALRRFTALAAAALFFASGGSGASGPAVSLAILNARVWTGHANRPWAEAVAVRGGRIAAVGSSGEIRALAGPETRIVDAGGRAVIPGLIDAHFHLLDLSRTGGDAPLNLRFIADPKELGDVVAAHARTVPPGAWIFGEGWDERKWGGALPTRAWIDRGTPRNPVWLLRGRGEAGLANTAALKAAGIGLETPGCSPGGIVRDQTGAPTGLIWGGSMELMDAVLAERAGEEAGKSVEAVMARLAAWGVTSVQHSGSWQELLVFQRLHREHRLRTRIYAAVPLPAWTRMRDYVQARGRGDAWLRWGALKLFKMSWTQAPVLDRSGRPDRWSSLPTEAEVYGWFEGATRAGLPIMVHAGGLEILRIFQRVHDAVHPPDPRFRIEHAHNVPPEWIPLYASARVIASVQPPLWAAFDRGEGGGPPPKDLFPCRRLLEAGVKVVLGTDSVTATPLMSPFEVMAQAMARPGPDGRRLTLEQCLTAYTRDAAFAEFSEGDKGTLEPGKLADLILLDRDCFQAPVEALPSLRVLMTVLDGRIVHEVDPAGAP